MATKKDAVAEGGEGKKKGKGKLIIIVVLLLLILGGAGGGWYWWTYMMNPDAAGEGFLSSFMGSDAKAGKDNGKKKKKKDANAGPVFVSLDAFTVNLQGDDGQLLQTAIALQVGDDEDAAKIKQHMPLVRSRLVMLLSSKRAEEVLTSQGKVSLAQEIAEQVKQPFFPGDYPMEIQNVLFTSFIVQ